MSTDRLENVCSRLEKVAVQLESISCKRSGGSDTGDSQAVEAFNNVLDGGLKDFLQISEKIGDEVIEASKILQKGFNLNLDLIRVASTTKKPPTEKLIQSFKPLFNSIEELKNFASKNFKSKFKSHLEAIAAYADALTWIQTPAKPQNLIAEIINSGVFYTNRILKDFKETPNHKEWVNSLKKAFEGLQEYAAEFHGMGLAWNPSGKEFSGVSSGATQTVTPKAATTASPAKPAAAANPGALFAELNAGASVTSGLKKVDDSMKTHKNPNLRTTAQVPGTTATKTSTSKPKTEETVNPPRFELVDKRYMIENYREEKFIEIEEAERTYTVNLFNCHNTTVLIHPKINQVSFLKCQRCKVQVKSGLIASAEVTSSKNIEIHADEILPFITINTSESVQVYLKESSKDSKVCTSASSSVNVCLWHNDDLIEKPVPEVFVSSFSGTELVTEISKDI